MNTSNSGVALPYFTAGTIVLITLIGLLSISQEQICQDNNACFMEQSKISHNVWKVRRR